MLLQMEGITTVSKVVAVARSAIDVPWQLPATRERKRQNIWYLFGICPWVCCLVLHSNIVIGRGCVPQNPIQPWSSVR